MARETGDNKNIWNERGELVPLNPHPSVQHSADVAVIIVSRNRPDLVDSLVGQIKGMGHGLSKDMYVVEMGTDEDKLSEHCSLRYDDTDYRGKCYGHNVGLRLARSKGNYRYYWILMNDLVFEDGVDALRELVDVAEKNPQVAILSPAEPESESYPACKPRPGIDMHIVSTCDYLSLFMRAESVNDVGFLNPDFKYCWGAIHELAYKLYTKGWQIAYCDRVTMKHLGGTTYGKVKGTISAAEYRRRAMEFAARYFVEHYGNRWDESFTRVLPEEIEFNTFKLHRRVWESYADSWQGLLEDPQDIPRPFARRVIDKVRSVGRRLLEKNAGDPSTAALEKQIEALHPWYYDVRIGTIQVTPGIGSKQTAEELEGRIKYRMPLLVGEVAKRYDFTGKRLLDIASNCGYWSARYAELGATSLLAVEGRTDYVEQGWLYWRNNQFMKPGAFEFMHGNVMKSETWDRIRERAPFDFTLCCGILYHIPEYEMLVRDIAAVTEDALLIDTRVSESEERIEEPGGWCFDSIIETRVKRVPALKSLIRLMDELGFRVEILSIDMPTPVGLQPFDDYNEGKRVALLGRKGE